MMRVSAALLVLLAATGCRSAHDTGAGPMRWTPAETSPLLAAGVTLRASYYPYISPTTYDWYAFHRGRKLESLDEFKKHVRSIESEEQAVAYRDLLRRVRLERDESVFARAVGTSLDYRSEHRHWNAEYGAAEVARWNVATERTVTRRGTIFEIVEVQHRYIPDTSPPEPDVVRVGTEAVELVMETITVDGDYKRTVLRTLEQGRTAHTYGPAPLL